MKRPCCWNSHSESPTKALYLQEMFCSSSILQLVVFLLALFYVGASACTVDLAHILQNTAKLNISTEVPLVVHPSEPVTLTCTTACGSIEWLLGNVTVITNSMYLCTLNNTPPCDDRVNSLGCDNAKDGKYVGSNLTFIPHETMQVQCQSRLTNIGVPGIRIPSKAALIILKQNTEPVMTSQPIAPTSIVPTSAYSSSSSSSHAPTRPEMATTSSTQLPSSCSCSPSPEVRPPTVDPMQVFQNATLCVNTQSFTFSAAGIGVLFIIIALSGWIVCCCCVRLRHNRSEKLVEQDSSRPNSTLDNSTPEHHNIDLTDNDWQTSSTAKIATMV